MEPILSKEQAKNPIALLKLLGEYVSDDITRGLIQRAYVSADRLTFVATDGHALVKLVTKEAFLPLGPEGTVDVVAGTHNLKAGLHPVVAPLMEFERYPEFERVIPVQPSKEDKGARRHGFDARLFGVCMSAIAAFGKSVDGSKQSGCVVCFGDDSTQPARIDTSGHAFGGWTLTAVVMPMRVE